MKNSKKALLGLAALTPFASCTKAPEQQRPNIVFFIVDDMGWMDTSVPFGDESYPLNQRYVTPNMQRLAEAGVMMTSSYACPVSTPTRTSLMSGMNAAHTHITNWTSTLRDLYSEASGGGISNINKGAVESPTDRLSHPVWNINGMSPEAGVDSTLYATPMVQLLKDAGYYTIHVGKAHWASTGTPGASPHNMGFCVNIAGSVNGMPRSYQSRDHYGNTPEKWNYLAVQNMAHWYDTDTHLTEALTVDAIKTLDYPIENGIPFYLYMAHYSNHTPIQADDRFYQKYIDMGLDEGQARYASMVEGMDKSLGDILDYLEEKNVADNTIIIFMTDNGGNSENKQKGGERFTHNAPLRNGKGSVYEGGIRVPTMFCWPGKITPGTRISNNIIAEDLFPTILEMAGIEGYDVVQEVDGKSLVKLLTDGSAEVAKAMKDGRINDQREANRFYVSEDICGIDPYRDIVLHYPHKWKPYDLEDIDFLSSVRKGEWKLVYRLATQEIELYNTFDDIGETKDLASENPEKAAELAKALGDRLRGWESPMPFIKETGKPVPMPDEI